MRPLFQARVTVTAERIEDSEAERFQPLLERCEDFFRRCYGRPARPDEGRQLPLERPPGLPPGAGHLIAVSDASGQWVGVLEGLQGYKKPQEAYLGLMLLAPHVRGLGLGAAVLRGYEDWLRAEGMQELRVGVSEPNTSALRFWRRMGFEDEEWVGPLQYGELSYRVLRMRKTLTSPAASP